MLVRVKYVAMVNGAMPAFLVWSSTRHYADNSEEMKDRET